MTKVKATQTNDQNLRRTARKTRKRKKKGKRESWLFAKRNDVYIFIKAFFYVFLFHKCKQIIISCARRNIMKLNALPLAM